MKAKLTDTLIRKTPPPALPQRYLEIWDLTLPGLYAQISHGGTRSFAVMIRIGGRQVRRTLGRYPALSLADARRKAREFFEQAAAGVDPKAEAKRQERESRAEDATTFAAVAELFVERYCKRRGLKSWAETQRILRRYVVPRWGDRQLANITRADVVDLMDDVEDNNGATMSRRVLAVVRKLFNWALDERGLIDTTPIGRGMARGRERTRNRYLDADEIRAVWAAADAEGYPFGDFTKLLLVLGQRRVETATRQWEHIDLDAGTLTIAAEDTKSSRTQVLPLSDMALAIIEAIPRTTAPWLFTNTGRGPIVGFGKPKARIAAAAGIAPWGLHDLRATVATHMGEDLRIPPHIIGAVLDHDPKRYSGTTAIYLRGARLDDKRQALDRWAEHLRRTIAGKPVAKVVPLKAGG